MYKDILISVSKPSRYIGQEINSVRKDLSKVRTKVALIFPDVYEIGMSHLGLKILYHIINSMEDVAAERAFVPWIDLEEVLTRRGLPLVSLESSYPLRGFDIIGFTLPYELCYTNILTTLALAGIPLFSSGRNEDYPLVIGGGTAVFNPEPAADFFDAFLLGDGEEGVVDIIHTYNGWKAIGKSKEYLLRELSKIEGVYVPSLYNVEYNDDGTIHSIRPRGGVADNVKRRVVEDLDRTPYPTSTPLPYMQTVHDRLTVEIARGCTHGCRFCQAGMIYRPVRERSPEKIIEIIDSSLKNTGYEEVSLASLSTGDFACLSNILTSLIGKYADEHVSFSLPSLRIGTLTPTIIDQVTGSKATLFSLRSMQALPLSEAKNASFTIAPEAGTERLRKVINKEMDEGIFEATVNDVFRKGVKSIKMYFMIGLPTEDEEDLQGIIGLTRKAREIGRRYGKGKRDITVSVSTFVPKSHTPFQWYGQAPKNEIRRKIDYLKNGLKGTGVLFKWHRSDMSYLEAVFSRGDRRLGKVIEAAWRSGCRFDSWTERLDFQKWEGAFNQCGIDPDFYASRQIPMEEILPWEHLHTGVTKDFLIKEYNRAMGGRIIPDCRYGSCPNCGVCDMEAVRGEKAEGIRPIARMPEESGEKSPLTPLYKRGDRGIIDSGIIDGGIISEVRSKKIHTPIKVRIKYAKTGDMRMLSQLEVMNTFARAFRRAHIPTQFSEGFHPHPRVSFGPALPVGTESVCEYMDVELTRPVILIRFKEDCNRCLPEGLRVMSIKEIPYNTPSLNSFITFYAYEIKFQGNENPPLPVALLRSNGTPAPLEKGGKGGFEGELWAQRIIERDGKKILREINTRPFIEDIRWTTKDTLSLLLKSRGGECCRPSDVISALFKTAPDDPRVRIKRTGLYGKAGGVMVSPDNIREEMERICLPR